jgi:beta-galactosidase
MRAPNCPRWYGLVLLLWSVALWAAEPETGRKDIDLSGPGWRLFHDSQASWADDAVFAPPVDLAALPVHPPTGGWKRLAQVEGTVPCAIPGTVEEYLGDGGGPATAAKLQGVSWFWRDLVVPVDLGTRRVLLEFAAVRQRAEVFLDETLVGYDAVGMTPFTCEVTGKVVAGRTYRLAVRITNPGGNYDWRDYTGLRWGKQIIPMSHAFGGFAEGLRLVLREPVSCDDVWVRNTPEPRHVMVNVTLANTGHAPATCSVQVRLLPLAGSDVPVAMSEDVGVVVPSGGATRTFTLHAPTAALWSPQAPNRYRAEVEVREGLRLVDRVERTFGFRWFAPEGIGSDAVFRLNGARIVLRTAISWGIWPITGLYPTDRMAERQVRAAQELGLNMLSFHRSPGHVNVLEAADRLGLLYYQEPGGYVSVGKDPVGQALARERLLRLVKRDRSHPSLVLWNMINEQNDSFGFQKDAALQAVHQADLVAAHALDPSRTITYTSAWAKTEGLASEEWAKTHMRPNDEQIYRSGWFDVHRAGGPAVWRQGFYQDPDSYYARTGNRAEIVFNGEEGAMSAPPRLGLIARELASLPHLGWDGRVYREWNQEFERFLDAKGLRATYPDADALCAAMGAASIDHQGRKIQLARINDVIDGYAVNGWEATLTENHSGIVDAFRFPKGDPALMAKRGRPVQVAVMPRKLVVGVPGTVTLDVYLINEGVLAPGPGVLRLVAVDADGREGWTSERPITVAGGEVYGQLLVRDVTVTVPTGQVGIVRLIGQVRRAGAIVAEGDDAILAVDWRSQRLSGAGAVLESTTSVTRHLVSRGATVTAFAIQAPRLDWVVLASSPRLLETVPSTALRTAAGKPGLETTFLAGTHGQDVLHRRTDQSVALNVSAGANPDPAVGATNAYRIVWEGMIQAPGDGRFILHLEVSDPVSMTLDGKLVLEDTNSRNRMRTITASMELTAGRPLPMRIVLRHGDGPARCVLRWSRPVVPALIDDLARRCREDGTTLIALEGAGDWIAALKPPGLTLREDFELGQNWVGGQMASRPHPLLAGLPSGGVLDGYFGGVLDDQRRRGLDISGEELVIAAYRSWPFTLGTALGTMTWGKGRLVLSTLNIVGHLDGDDSVDAVAKRLLGNAIAFSRPVSP